MSPRKIIFLIFWLIPYLTAAQETSLIPPAFSSPAGFYESDFLLELSSAHPNSQILYTLDGSRPHPDHIGGSVYSFKPNPSDEMEERFIETHIYEGPIQIINRSSEANTISALPNSYANFSPPKNQLDKATTVRAALWHDDQLSDIITKTYFTGNELKEYLSLPILSLTVQEDDFWSYEHGIYVPGINYDPDAHNNSGNFFQRGREWERPVNLQYFNEDGLLEFSQDAGIRIHGNTSRRYVNRSFRIYARSDYGKSTIDYPLFKNRPDQQTKRLKLRNSGQDIINTFFRDALMSSLMIDTEVTVEDAQPVQIFLNGEYWGILNMRERFDQHFLEQKFSTPRDDFDILERWGVNHPHYNQFMEILDQYDPDHSEFYTDISKYINPLSLFDLRIADIFLGRWDIHHWKIWRDSKDSESIWEWVMWDMDVGMGLPNNWGPDWSHGAPVDANYLTPFLTDFRTQTYNYEFSIILENETARNVFLNRFALLLSTHLRADRIVSEIDRFAAQIEQAIPKHIERWSEVQGISSVENWLEDVALLRSFAQNRHNYIYEHILSHFDLEGTAQISFEPNAQCADLFWDGEPLMPHFDSQADSSQNQLSVQLFKNIPLTLKQEIRDDDCEFEGWYINDELYSKTDKIDFHPTDEATITAKYATDVSSDYEEEIAGEIQLYQNYPNPFNPTTTISFSLPETGQVRLTIHNQLGQRVATLVDDFLSAGSHDIVFSADHLSSGIYIYRLEFGDTVTSKKMTLIK